MRAILGLALTISLAGPAIGQELPSDIPKKFTPVVREKNFVRRAVEIPMRDGVKLHTVILIKNGLVGAPMILERTPYDADGFIDDDAVRTDQAVRGSTSELVDAGYIFVAQDVRGKHGSQGVYVNERPLIGPANTSKVDHATDAYDTIAWLVKNVPESNGRVGMIGNSYDGMMVAMALTNPHPALKAAVPMNPVINTWKGDDDFHGGAFRMVGYDFYFSQDTKKGKAGDLFRDAYDDYDTFLRAGSASEFVKSRGLEQLPVVTRMRDHATYDNYWQAQALEDILPRRAPSVPTLWVASQWDQEDIYGAMAAYEAVSKNDPQHLNRLVLGPWPHGGWSRDGSTLGAIKFDADTGRQFRQQTLIPFLDANLKTDGKPVDLPQVLAFQTGTNRWQRLPAWPLACEAGCGTAMTNYAFSAGATLQPGTASTAGSDEYVADPAKPVPYRLRPIRPTYASGSTWGQWLVDDQRPFSDRTDVLTYTTPPLTAPVAISGAAVATLMATTTGTDADWVVKLIDVYPDLYAPDQKMSGYQLPVAMDILRGRYRDSFSDPKPVTAGAVTGYRVTLPNANHVFLPGHRIMVQVQSSWFPLYDRNPQSYVPNIFDAKAGDYRKATIHVLYGGAQPSGIALPVVPYP